MMWLQKTLVWKLCGEYYALPNAAFTPGVNR